MHNVPDTIFKTLADPTRRAIFERRARDGAQTVRVLTSHSGVSPPAVSKHLAIDWMALYGAFWRDRFDRLQDTLKRMDQ